MSEAVSAARTYDVTLATGDRLHVDRTTRDAIMHAHDADTVWIATRVVKNGGVEDGPTIRPEHVASITEHPAFTISWGSLRRPVY